MVDDLYQRFAPVSVAQRRNICTAKMSDPEIITLSICSEVIGIDSEKAWYSFVKRNCRHLFPDLCCRTRFNRTAGIYYRSRNCSAKSWRSFFLYLQANIMWSTAFPFLSVSLGVPDSAVLSVRMMQIMGNVRPKKKLIREGLRDFAENHLNLVILGDKGYTGEQLLEDMRSKGICLMSLKPSSYKTNWPKEIRQLIFRFRRRVETVFSQLSEQMKAERVLAKNFRGLCPRLQNKILGHNLCMAFNSIFREACDIGKIKQLVF